MAAFTAVMDGYDVIALLEAMATTIPAAISDELVVGSELIAEVMRQEAPVGVGGDKGLQGSIGYEIDPILMESEIKPSVPYADAVETGTKPHRPPAGPGSALDAWAKLKGLNPWAVATNIAKYGTKANPYIASTYDEVQEPATDAFATGIELFLARLQA